MIYLDNHSTTALDPRVLEAMLPVFTESFGNPASHSHRYGLDAERAVEKARRQVAGLLGASVREIVFNAGATEGNNFVLRSVLEAAEGKKDHLVVSAVEHKCVLETAGYLARRGVRVTFLPVDTDGRVDPAEVARVITPKTALVSVILANNEIGSLNPVGDIGRICQERGVLFHTDAAQAVGKIPLDLSTLPVDFLTSSAHKFYGPKGVGFVYIRRTKPPIDLQPQILGGGQESGLRSGTSNVPGIVGMGKAAELAGLELEHDLFHVWTLRNRLWDKLAAGLGEALFLNGPALDPVPPGQSLGGWSAADRKRLPGNLNFGIPELNRDRFFKLIRNLALSYGSACASGDLSVSHVLRALGVPDDRIQSSLRAGVGRFNTLDQIDEAAEAIATAHRRTLS